MLNFLAVFFAIIGTVIGSGFISGKEIVVFFARFGYWSFPCIVFSFFLFFFLFKFLLFKGPASLKHFENSKVVIVSNLFLCLTFSSAMFAGVVDMLRGLGKILTLIFIIILFFLCALVCKKGVVSLNKINFILVPVMSFVLIVGVVYLLSFNKVNFLSSSSFSNGFLAVFYSILYVVLNTSNGFMLISKLGEKLPDRQKTRVAFLSALVLCLILLLVDLVLLQKPSSFVYDMPLLSLFSGIGKNIFSFAILIGCVTTLFSLIYSCSSSMRGLCNNEILIFFVSVILPYLLSLSGFGFIVSYFYPLASVVGVFLLSSLAFIPFFKRTDKKIHSHGKNAK